MLYRSLLALSTSLALVSCNLVPNSYKGKEENSTAAMLRAGDRQTCSADNVRKILRNMIATDVAHALGLSKTGHGLRLELSAITMTGKKQEVQSVDCNANAVIKLPSLGKDTDQFQIDYKISPSADDPNAIVVKIADMSDIKASLISLLDPPSTGNPSSASEALAFVGKYPSDLIGKFSIFDAPDLKSTIFKMPNGSRIWSAIIAKNNDLAVESAIHLNNPGPYQSLVVFMCEAHNCGGPSAGQLLIEYFPNADASMRQAFVCVNAGSGPVSYGPLGDSVMQSDECKEGRFFYGD